MALNAMLAEAHWRGAPEAAAASGPRATKPEPVPADKARARRAELDEDAARDRHDRLVQPPGLTGAAGAVAARDAAGASRRAARLRRPWPMSSPTPVSRAPSPRTPSSPRSATSSARRSGASARSSRRSRAAPPRPGVVPIENVIHGTVRENYDLLLEHDLAIRGEVVVPVTLCLAALPGQRIEDIERVYSHIQALGQAEAFLRARPWQLLSTYNTAGAGKAIADAGERGAAAVLSPRAAGAVRPRGPRRRDRRPAATTGPGSSSSAGPTRPAAPP